MPSAFAKLLQLPMRDRILLAEAVTDMGIAALAVAVLPFRTLAALASRTPHTPFASGQEIPTLVDGVRWAVEAAARRVPWRAKCFEQCLGAHLMLGGGGVPCVLWYGGAHRGASEMAVYVWVRDGVLDVVGCDIAWQLALVAKFPDHDDLRAAP